MCIIVEYYLEHLKNILLYFGGWGGGRGKADSYCVAVYDQFHFGI